MMERYPIPTRSLIFLWDGICRGSGSDEQGAATTRTTTRTTTVLETLPARQRASLDRMAREGCAGFLHLSRRTGQGGEHQGGHGDHDKDDDKNNDSNDDDVSDALRGILQGTLGAKVGYYARGGVVTVVVPRMIRLTLPFASLLTLPWSVPCGSGVWW